MTGSVTHSQIEFLEGRIAPAGLITVTFNNGALELTSDNGAHSFGITALDATTVQLLGTDGTVFHMEGAMDSDSVILTTPIKSLSVTLGSDADQLSVAGLNVGGDIAIDLGGGNNALRFDTITAKRGLEIKGGAAGDDIKIQGGASFVKKDLVLDLGEGENRFDPQSALLDVGGSLTYTGGAGVDSISLSGSLKVKGSAAFNWGAGTNSFGTQVILISNFSVGKDLSFDSSASGPAIPETTSIGLAGLTLSVKGNLEVLDGAGFLDMNPLSGPGLIAKIGSANIVTGGGEAHVGFANSAVSAKSIFIDASESSSSQALLGGFAGSFSSNLTYIGGAGNDQISLQLLSGVNTKGLSNLKLDLGDGLNSVQAFSYAGFFKNVSVTGGSGSDTLVIAAVSAKMSNIAVENGDGDANTQIQLVDSKVSGQIKVTNGTGAGLGGLSLSFLSSQIRGVSYTSDLASNEVSFGTGLGLFFSDAFTIKNSFEVKTGAGNDKVNFQSVTNSKFGKGINLSLGDGENEVGVGFGNVVSKALTITGGSGPDNVEISGSGSLGAVNVSLGAGSNFTALSGNSVALGLSSLNYTSASDGMATDTLLLARIQVLGKSNTEFGAGSSTLKIDDSVFGGPFTADTGAGGDFVSIDTEDSNASTILTKPVTIILGDGDDMLTLGGADAVSTIVNAKAAFKADGGSGMNTLTNSAGNIFAKDPVFEKLT